jgi:UDP-2,3-diacylglucosamine pyrophosphatase LpxH
VATAIISDLHLGTVSGCDITRRPEVRERLLEALAPADRVVLLGDALDLRERPTAEVLKLARPLLEGLGQVTEDKQLMVVPGNHDHELVAPALEAARLDGAKALPTEGSFDLTHSPLAVRVAALMPRTEVGLAYPGIRLREDVYATHGHYLDLHLTVPRMECLLASAIARFTGVRGAGAPPVDAYEAALSPIYAFAHSVVQGSPAGAVTKSGNLSRSVWRLSNPDGGRSLAGLALARIAIPAAVAAINAAGLGPFRADLSSAELRRAGLRAMAAVVAATGIDADHVIFGHTHRAGPLDGEVEGWWLPGGTRLTNTGSWLYEAVFVDGSGPENPYWPGRVTWLDETGPPEQVGVLADVDLPGRSRG